MHKTEAGEKRKALRAGAQELARDARAARKAAEILPEASRKAMELEGQAEELRSGAADLKDQARLEDLRLWVMEKARTTKKGSRSYGYWMASWREGGKVRNVHLGSCRRMDEESALQKARKLKAESLGISAAGNGQGAAIAR